MSAGFKIAICGLAGRFPGAPDLETFWENLAAGRRGLRQFSEEELDRSGVERALRARRHYVPAGGVLDDIDAFDAVFFGFTPREAQLTDPQQRLFMECASEALEDAAIIPDPARLSIGVFASAGMDSYFRSCLAVRPDILETYGFDQLRIGNRIDNLATRTAYKLNLNGPSLTVQTGCSSSLVAVHMAARSLLLGECDVAIAGGVRISVGRHMGYVHVPGGVLSPDGHCRAFDAEAGGTVPGDGVGVVVLRRLEDAVAKGNPIDAVILSSAVNNDGAAKIGYTAPSVDGQTAVIAEALALADISPATVSHVEAHGTATPLGDPIEIAALTAAFRAGTRDTGYCAVTSVKSSIGHLDAAAGIAGLLRTVLELRHGMIAPSVDFVSPNPRLALEDSPFFVNDRLRQWPVAAHPRRAGVSSFGIGGTNAHVLLEEAPPRALEEGARNELIFPLSAKTAAALSLLVKRMEVRLSAADGTERAALARTFQVGRGARPVRAAFVAVRGREPVITVSERSASADPPTVAFLFPGQGAQRPGMCAGIWRDEPVFREAFAAVAALHGGAGGCDLEAMVFGSGAQDAILQQTMHAQPAIFAVEYAMARLFMSWGVAPDAMIGHSVGELTCACLAGVYGLEDTVALVGRRAKLMQAQPKGRMLAVALNAEDIVTRLPGGVDLAAANGRTWSVASGPAKAIDALAARLDKEGVANRALLTSHAFHSAMMSPAATAFAAFADEVRPSRAETPYLSCVTGDWITEEDLATGGYWGRQMRGAVRFGAGVARLLETPGRILLELGPGETLTRLVGPECDRGRGQMAISADSAGPAPATAALAELWASGIAIDWERYGADRPRSCAHAPAHPMVRRRYWVDSQDRPAPATQTPVAPTSKEDPLAPFDDWFYAPSWVQAHRTDTPRKVKPQLVIASRSQLAGAFADLPEAARLLDPAEIGTVEALGSRLLAALTDISEGGSEAPRILFVADNGGAPDILRLAGLGRALAETLAGAAAELTVVTKGAFDVLGEEPTSPELAMLAGFVRVMGQEIPGLTATTIDVAAGERNLAAVLAEHPSRGDGSLVALRRGRVWTRDARRIQVRRSDLADHVRPDGSYLITGGLGGIGLALAGALAEAGAHHIVLTGRRTFPAREDWRDWQRTHGAQDSTSRRIERLLAAEAHGARMSVVTGDLADPAVVARAVEDARANGCLRGLVHAAGIPGGGAMVLQGASAIMRVLGPKVAARQLADLVGEEPLHWVVLFSSLTALRGGVGQADYAAANAYLDALAEARAFAGARQVISINWAAWGEVGMAAEAALAGEGSAERAARLARAIPPERGVEAFASALATRAPRIVVCPYPLTLTPEPAAPSPDVSRHPRPKLLTPYAAARNPVERRLAEIWQQLFGLDRIGVNDDFFELGGHSLMATQLVAGVRAAFGARLPLARLFESTTIAVQAELIEETLIDELERLDEAEADTLAAMTEHGQAAKEAASDG